MAVYGHCHLGGTMRDNSILPNRQEAFVIIAILAMITISLVRANNKYGENPPPPHPIAPPPATQAHGHGPELWAMPQPDVLEVEEPSDIYHDPDGG